MKSILLASKKVFSKKSYFFLAIIMAIVFYSLNAIISDNVSIVGLFLSYPFFTALKLTFLGIGGFHYFINTSSFASLIIISVLFGMLFSFIAYKTKNLKESSAKKIGSLGTIGIFLGVLAPACAACGVGIASALGLGAFLTFLPYKGLEISILSIILLFIANLRISRNLLKDNVCQVFDDRQKSVSKK